jgi:hypothetical protein
MATILTFEFLGFRYHVEKEGSRYVVYGENAHGEPVFLRGHGPTIGAAIDATIAYLNVLAVNESAEVQS